MNGAFENIYCENLCYISRMFLDHKCLDASIECFFFYVLTLVQEDGFHFLGYFSKDRLRTENQLNNLSCIMVLPCFQKGGYGKTIVEMSYALSMKEKKPGTPERPLSDLGHRMYVNFWTRRVVKVLLDYVEKNSYTEITLKNISERTGMIEDDIIYILKHHNIRRGQ